MSFSEVNRTAVSCDIFAEFLEVSLHSILYNRQIYPPGVFQRRKKYNVPVQMCVHPEVSEYIAKVIESVKVMVANGDVSMVTAVLLDQSGTPLERFVFELGNSIGSDRDDQYLFRLEDALRSFLLKLNVADSILQSLPQGCRWVVHVHTIESTADKFIQTQTIKMQLYVEESALKRDAVS